MGPACSFTKSELSHVQGNGTQEGLEDACWLVTLNDRVPSEWDAVRGDGHYKSGIDANVKRAL
jgi:hypothetical protein